MCTDLTAFGLSLWPRSRLIRANYCSYSDRLASHRGAGGVVLLIVSCYRNQRWLNTTVCKWKWLWKWRLWVAPFVNFKSPYQSFTWAGLFESCITLANQGLEVNWRNNFSCIKLVFISCVLWSMQMHLPSSASWDCILRINLV